MRNINAILLSGLCAVLASSCASQKSSTVTNTTFKQNYENTARNKKGLIYLNIGYDSRKLDRNLEEIEVMSYERINKSEINLQPLKAERNTNEEPLIILEDLKDGSVGSRGFILTEYDSSENILNKYVLPFKVTGIGDYFNEDYRPVKSILMGMINAVIKDSPNVAKRTIRYGGKETNIGLPK